MGQSEEVAELEMAAVVVAAIAAAVLGVDALLLESIAEPGLDAVVNVFEEMLSEKE